MRLLIDECLSIDLVSVASQAGHEAQHVAHVGKAGWKGWNVARYASDGDFVLVTNNAGDFRRLYAVQPLHAGRRPVLSKRGSTQPEKPRDFGCGVNRRLFDETAPSGDTFADWISMRQIRQ